LIRNHIGPVWLQIVWTYVPKIFKFGNSVKGEEKPQYRRISMIRTRQFKAGEVIFLENDIGETAYVIEQGRVEVLKNVDGKNIHLAYIGAGEPFGEMSMIDEKPRSATIVALEPTSALELHRDDFVRNLQMEPEITIRLLKVLFERLREADATIVQLYGSHPELAPSQPAQVQNGAPGQSGVVVCLEGLTPQASNLLPAEPFRITKFPFRIGRQSADPLVENDLSIPDPPPMQISRHHLAIIQDGKRIGILDRGSRLGSLVDGKPVGGQRGAPRTVFLTETESLLVLGTQASNFKFKVTQSFSSAAR
jgi:CRP-like cAMP-binding protein